MSGYYWYLPSLFIYNDLKNQSFKDDILVKYAPTNSEFQQGMKVENGNYVMKYASGMAVMYLPFFLTAHVLAAQLGYPPDGFSTPYQFAIQFGGVLIAILGLWFFRKLLLFFYTDKVVALVLVLLVFGTNYLNLSAIDAGMSHSWLFTVYVFLLLNTHYFYHEFKMKYAVRIGLLVGLAALTRPTDIVSCLIPLLWGMESLTFKAIKERIILIISKYKPLLTAVFCAFIVFSIQLIYWKYVSGHWLVYSYGGQEFSWKYPNIYNYTFSYRSGWLLYCPAMLLAFLGVIPFVKSGKNNIAILSFFLLNYYIVCAWEIWWYGGRAMVQSYPILFFPIASLVNFMIQKRVTKWIFVALATLFIYCNIWITVQYHWGNLYDNNTMTKEYFWRIAGRWSAPENTFFLRDKSEVYEDVPKNINLVYKNEFTQDTSSFYTTDSIKKITSLVLNQSHQLSPVYRFPYQKHTAKWLRAEATFYGKKEGDVWKMTQFVVQLIDNSNVKEPRIVKENMIRVHRLLNDYEQKNIRIDIKLPEEYFDSVHLLFWNGGGDKQIEISDLKVWEF